MAKRKTQDSTPVAGLIKARVLVSCSLGEPDDVVEIDAATATAHAGEIDAHPDAVAYAEGLLS